MCTKTAGEVIFYPAWRISLTFKVMFLLEGPAFIRFYNNTQSMAFLSDVSQCF